jgi:aspartyl-tRNA(Asn)/glutamyl-tRNA(Gln) amidotransferase subunit C
MSSALSRAEVVRIAALARLELSETELDTFARQLGDILHYAGQIQAVDTTNVPPYANTSSSASALREDVPVASLPRERALENAPSGDRAAGTFVVPKVIG